MKKYHIFYVGCEAVMVLASLAAGTMVPEEGAPSVNAESLQDAVKKYEETSGEELWYKYDTKDLVGYVGNDTTSRDGWLFVREDFLGIAR